MAGGFFLIPDGCNLPGKVEAVAGVTREAHFTYRPADYPALMPRKMAASVAQRIIEDAKLAAEHTANWQIVNDDGTRENVVVTADVLKSLPAHYLEVALAYVTCSIGTSVESVAGKSDAASG